MIARLLAQGTSILLAATGLRAQTWDLQNDWSPTDNPTGAWSYGYSDTLGSAFVLFDSTSVGWEGSIGWFPHWADPDDGPIVWKHTGITPKNGVSPGEVSLHPGPAWQPAIVRWTAPDSMRARVRGKFCVGDLGVLDGYILVNDAATFQALDIAGADASFDLVLEVVEGDTVDFAVTGGWAWGNTPLYATISPDCPADFNGDGALNIFDFLAFQTAFGGDDPATDLAPPFGILNLFDFLAFQTAYGNGC